MSEFKLSCTLNGWVLLQQKKIFLAYRKIFIRMLKLYLKNITSIQNIKARFVKP